MESSRHEDVDPRSPKRHAVVPASAHAVAALDTAIWTSIIEFLPIPRQFSFAEKLSEWSTRKKQDDAKVSEAVATWQTLLNLRLVSKELATLLHPVESQTLWRRLLLQSFDFSVDGGFNVDVYLEEHGLTDPDDDSAEEQHEEQDPQVVAMHGRYDGMPSEFLDESLAQWSNLGISHRPSQYGFLTTLQQQPQQQQSVDSLWSASEDAFTLFRDIVLLLQLPDGEGMLDCGESGDSTFKYLAAPAEAGSSSAFYRFYVMKTLGYIPHVWHRGRGIGKEWKQFDEPENAFESSVAEQFEDNNLVGGISDEEEQDEFKNDDTFDDCNEFNFPECSIRDGRRLFQHIRRHCSDWRSVCCNDGSDGTTPVFFVGESKASRRWMGYAGRKCWT